MEEALSLVCLAECGSVVSRETTTNKLLMLLGSKAAKSDLLFATGNLLACLSLTPPLCVHTYQFVFAHVPACLMAHVPSTNTNAAARLFVPCRISVSVCPAPPSSSTAGQTLKLLERPQPR